MKGFFVVCCLAIALIGQAQDHLWSPDSLSASSPNAAMNKYNRLLQYHEPLMYLTYPVIKPIETRKIPLREGEGLHDFWLEGNFANRFVIHKGKYYNPDLLQRLRFTFDVAITPRLTRDESSPLLPSNNEFGFGLDVLLSSIKGLLKKNTTPAWLTIQLHHYSNGQADSFYIKDENGNERNNYRSGDFSTDFVRILFNVAHISAKDHILSASVGLRNDIDIKGPLGVTSELYHSYGRQRLLFNFQWLKASRLVILNNMLSSKTEKVVKRRQFSFRTEMEYIVGDLSNFPLDNKYRFGAHAYLTYMPSITNEVGFMIHSYVGRDYLNIRYDDVVWVGELGLYMRINKR